MEFYPGFAISTDEQLEFHYGEGVFGPRPEKRLLKDIRASLADKSCSGPDVLYSIAMDVGKEKDRGAIVERNLLFGVVTYAKGCIGEEPVRSQGHIHSVSPSCHASTCEVYEIWDGEAVIYMQERGSDDAGRCYAIHAKAGDVVIVPPGWVHATINADIHRNMTFGAWCVRDYGFKYDEVRSHSGIAFFPIVKENGLCWKRNENYTSALLECVEATSYPQFSIERGVPVYTQFEQDPDRFLFVSRPQLMEKEWKKF